MRKLLLFFFVISAYSPLAFSETADSVAVTIGAVAAYGGGGRDHSDTVYRYRFSSSLGYGNNMSNCEQGSPFYYKTGDENINRLLQLAYVTGTRVKVGVDNNGKGCIINAIETQD